MWWFIPKCHGAMFRSSYSCTNNSFCGMVCKPPMSCFLKFPYSERGLLPPLQWTQVEVNRHIAYLNTVWVGVGMAAPVLLIIAVGVGAFIYCKKRFACHQKDSFLFRTEVLVGLGGTVVQIITMPMLSLTPQELLCGKQCKSPTSHWTTGPHNESLKEPTTTPMFSPMYYTSPHCGYPLAYGHIAILVLVL